MTATGAAGLTHIRRGDPGDLERLVRRLTGRAVGLVLSGGGARAYAHIGVIRALTERGVPIDFIGGASMGGVIAAGLALGWDLEEMDRRIRLAFVDSSPLDDIAFPMLAMTRGGKVARRLEENFGDVQFADLWRPCFCVSSNLTTGMPQVHRRGLVRAALRASISLPGLLPPATQGQNVLVDGAVLWTSCAAACPGPSSGSTSAAACPSPPPTLSGRAPCCAGSSRASGARGPPSSPC